MTGVSATFLTVFSQMSDLVIDSTFSDLPAPPVLVHPECVRDPMSLATDDRSQVHPLTSSRLYSFHFQTNGAGGLTEIFHWFVTSTPKTR